MRTRPKQPTAKLKLFGGFRADRHGDRDQEPQPKGTPVAPDDLSEWAQVHWQCVVPELTKMGLGKLLDTFALASMCEWWAEWKKLSNGEAGQTGHQRIVQMQMCHKSWRDLASRFGMTPADRASLTVETEKDSNPAAEFLA